MSDLRTALFSWHAEHKARLVPFGGWEMPVQYAGIVAEHRAVREAAGLFDISHMARVNFGGPDALKLLDRTFTNSVAGMKDGQVRYGLVCREDGGILDDILVYRWPDRFAAVINASNREKIRSAWAWAALQGMASTWAPAPCNAPAISASTAPAFVPGTLLPDAWGLISAMTLMWS